jgi:7-cyano-7-deazaguanine synthase
LKVNSNGKQVIVLSSGGIDSTGLIDFYLRRGSVVKGLFVNYQQPPLKREQQSFEKVVSHYSIEKKTIKLGFEPAQRLSEYSSRNALFLFIASSLGFNPTKIAMGIRANAPYFDCSPLFLKSCQEILDGYFGGVVRVEAPFLSFTKGQVIEYCRKYDVPLHLTYSCLRGDIPCGKCVSCIERARYLGVRK